MQDKEKDYYSEEKTTREKDADEEMAKAITAIEAEEEKDS